MSLDKPIGYIKGRGAQHNAHNRFVQHKTEPDNEYLEWLAKEGEDLPEPKTKYIEVFPKTIVNKVNSPDLFMRYSMNPYQGCEHGCIYCYARTTHEYWGYSAGIDFESTILIKKNAPELFDRELQNKNWKPDTIMLSGNTDCYQPIERKLGITRKLLEVASKHRHPMGIITKNALVLRDLDLFKEMASMDLISVTLSINSFTEDIREKLEPRTSTIKNRFKAVEILAKNNIPVFVLVAPIIPGVNDHQMVDIIKYVSTLGAWGVGYQIVRLNGAIGEVFTKWAEEVYPMRKDKILNQVKDLHGGNLNDSRFSTRFKGEGKEAERINQLFKIAKRKYFPESKSFSHNTTLFRPLTNNQLGLFD